MNYRELQKKAKDLNLNASGKAEEIQARIDEHEAKGEIKAGDPVNAPEPEYTEAAVFNGAEEVRVYSKEKHGKNFKELAKMYTSNPSRMSYRIELR